MLTGHLQTLSSSSGALSRRRFLLGAAAVGGGLAVGFRVAEAADGPVQAQTPFAHTQVNPLSAYLTITPEGLVIVHSAHMDMGQGSYHGLATLEGMTRRQNDRLYDIWGVRRAHYALRPGGILAVWSGRPDRRFKARLRNCGFTVDEVRVHANGSSGRRHVVWLATRPAENPL